MSIEVLFIRPQKLIPPQTKFLVMPLILYDRRKDNTHIKFTFHHHHHHHLFFSKQSTKETRESTPLCNELHTTQRGRAQSNSRALCYVSESLLSTTKM